MGSRRRKRRKRGGKTAWPWLSVEVAALAAGLLSAGVLALGLLAARFRGGGLWTNLVPFTAAALLLGTGATLIARTWLAARPWMLRHSPVLPASVTATLAGSTGAVSYTHLTLP